MSSHPLGDELSDELTLFNKFSCLDSSPRSGVLLSPSLCRAELCSPKNPREGIFPACWAPLNWLGGLSLILEGENRICQSCVVVEQFPVGPERGWIPWEDWDPSPAGKGRLSLSRFRDTSPDWSCVGQGGSGAVQMLEPLELARKIPNPCFYRGGKRIAVHTQPAFKNQTKPDQTPFLLPFRARKKSFSVVVEVIERCRAGRV